MGSQQTDITLDSHAFIRLPAFKFKETARCLALQRGFGQVMNSINNIITGGIPVNCNLQVAIATLYLDAGGAGCFACAFVNDSRGTMSCDIEAHITSKYDIKKRIGKGVG